VGVNVIEQLAHALEDILGALQKDIIVPTPGLFTICYTAIDAIQDAQKTYEEGKTSPPPSTLRAMADLESLREAIPHGGLKEPVRDPAPEPVKPAEEPRKKTGKLDVANLRNALQAANGDVEPSGAPPPAAPSAPPQPAPAPQEEAPAPTPGNGTSASSPAYDETIRVSVSKLDSLMAQLSELLITKIHAEQRLAQVRQAQEYMMLWQKEWLAARSAYGRVTRHSITPEDAPRQVKELNRLMEYLQVSQDRLREMTALLNSITREYHSDTMQLSLVIDRLEEEVKRVRMLPLNTITSGFGRMVRDIAQSSGKDVVLELRGVDVELDKRVLEQIKDPIIHLLRNAIDHGIETPQKRIANGKPSQGTITLSAEQLGKDVAISISDDGNGIDVDAIRQSALRRNVPGAATMSDNELVELIYNSGFSTSPIITDVSGRGVGLDVVRRNVETLRGRIHVEWTPSKGARFNLILPLTLTSSRALLVRASSQLFAIPVNAIERIEYTRPDQIESMGGHDTIRYEDRPLMLVNLSDVLNLPRPETRASDRIRWSFSALPSGKWHSPWMRSPMSRKSSSKVWVAN
jgi:two-component system, chemotaxis family, sensor kinase CheA